MTALRAVYAEALDPRNGGYDMVSPGKWHDDVGYSDVDDDTPKRSRYRCSDGMCGATDCDRCYPGGVYEGDDDEDEEQDEESEDDDAEDDQS